MAESTAVISGESANGVNQGSVVAPPKFVFGQNMSERIKNVPSSESSSLENSPKPSEKTDSDGDSDTTGFKRPAEFDENKQESSEEGGPLSPVKKAAKILKTNDEDKPRPFKLKPSILNEVAKNLADSSAKGDSRKLTSPVPKTFGLSTSEASSTETRTGASSPEPMGTKTKNYFQMFLSQQNDSSEGANHGSFVFGRNMGERVVFSTGESANNTEENKDDAEPKTDDGTSQLSSSPNKDKLVEAKTLAEVAESCAKAEGPQSPTTTPDKHHLSLAEAAQVYQEAASPSVKSKLAKVTVVTGEEEERNVMQINCRLFLFDVVNRNWKEKGRGALRLNDMCQSMSESIFQSRLVMRTQGNLRVMLNTKLWPEMTLDRANEKSLRVTAVDPVDNEIKIYLIMAGPMDIQQLFTAIDRRIQALKRGQEGHSETKPAESNNASPSPPNDTDKDSADIEDEDETSSKDRRTAGPDESSNDSCPDPCGATSNKEALSDDE